MGQEAFDQFQIYADSASDAYTQMCGYINKLGKPVAARGEPTLEVMNVSCLIKNPRDRIIPIDNFNEAWSWSQQQNKWYTSIAMKTGERLNTFKHLIGSKSALKKLGNGKYAVDIIGENGNLIDTRVFNAENDAQKFK